MPAGGGVSPSSSRTTGATATTRSLSRRAMMRTPCVARPMVRNSLMPDGDGQHFLVVNKSIRDKAKVKVGDRVTVVVEPDSAPRLIEAPPDLAKALGKDKTAKMIWDDFAYSHKKAYVDWIVSAKQDETRRRRIDKAVGLIAEKKPLK